jgi:hypothetical protein
LPANAIVSALPTSRMITFAPAWLLVHTKPRCRRSCRAIKWLLTLIFLVARGYAAHLAARNKVGTQFVAEEGSPQFVVWDEYLKMLGRHALATDCRAVDPLRIDPYEILVTADDDIGLVTAVAHELQDFLHRLIGKIGIETIPAWVVLQCRAILRRQPQTYLPTS